MHAHSRARCWPETSTLVRTCASPPYGGQRTSARAGAPPPGIALTNCMHMKSGQATACKWERRQADRSLVTQAIARPQYCRTAAAPGCAAPRHGTARHGDVPGSLAVRAQTAPYAGMASALPTTERANRARTHTTHAHTHTDSMGCREGCTHVHTATMDPYEVWGRREQQQHQQRSVHESERRRTAGAARVRCTIRSGHAGERAWRLVHAPHCTTPPRTRARTHSLSLP